MVWAVLQDQASEAEIEGNEPINRVRLPIKIAAFKSADQEIVITLKRSRIEATSVLGL